MKLKTRLKNSKIAQVAAGTVLGIGIAGTIFIYRNSLRNVPVVGPVVDNAANGLNGGTLARPLT